MTKHPTPITVFCKDTAEAINLFDKDDGSRALTSGTGTMMFHMLIAQHGAGVFKTLYVPLALRGSFKPPVGGEVRFTEGAQS